MTIQACAEIVHRADPDRFLATMSLPLATREVLFPLFAFNAEVARAPWVTQEPMIAEMRLQWWRDVVAEIAAGEPPRAHEVVAPLADVLARHAGIADMLDGLVAARRWDVYSDAFEDAAALDAYLQATGGGLAVASHMALTGEDADDPLRDGAYGMAVANLFLAVPELEQRGRKPLVDGRPEGVRALAEKGLAAWNRGPGAGAPALRSGWMTPVLLKQLVQSPERLAAGTFGVSELRKKGRLTRIAFVGG